MPAVSMEANIHVDESGNVTDVQSVDAIAGLKDDRPGFAGAIKLGEVYCFDATDDDETTEDKPVTMSETKGRYQGAERRTVAGVRRRRLSSGITTPPFSEPMRRVRAKLKKSSRLLTAPS